jgi:hypothetical protein
MSASGSRERSRVDRLPDTLALDDARASGRGLNSRSLRLNTEQYAGLPLHYLFGAIAVDDSG